MKREKGERFIILFWILVFIAVFFQHMFVWMYFDDYGYASLTYLGGNFKHGTGTDYTFLDIFAFLKYHYFNWGGRVVGYFFEIISLKTNVWIMRFLQSIIMFCGFLCAVKILTYNKRVLEIPYGLLFLGMYFLIGINTLNWGIYWFSASVSYVWSVAFFFIAMYFQIRFYERKELKYYVCCLVFFSLAAIFYEQSAVATVLYVILTEFFEKIKEKAKISIFNIILVLVVCLCGAFCILAPGNFGRSEIYQEFNNLSIIKKILTNLPIVLMINLEDSELLTSVYFIVGVYTTIKLVGKNNGLLNIFVWVYKSIMIGASALFACVIYMGLFANIKVAIETIWIICFSISVILYYLKRNNFKYLSLYLAGIMTQAMMLIAPQLNWRVHIFFAFVLIFISADILFSFVTDNFKANMYEITLLLFIIGLIFAGNITYKYFKNNVVHQKNNSILMEYANGDDSVKNNVIELYKLRDDKYACVMPYQQGFEFSEIWLKNYYGIQQNVEIKWKDYVE